MSMTLNLSKNLWSELATVRYIAPYAGCSCAPPPRAPRASPIWRRVEGRIDLVESCPSPYLIQQRRLKIISISLDRCLMRRWPHAFTFTISAPRRAEQSHVVAPHSGSHRFARNRSKEDPRHSLALLSGLGSQELCGVYRLIQITALTAINADSKNSIIKLNPKDQFFWGIAGWQFEQANLEVSNPRNHGVAWAVFLLGCEKKARVSFHNTRSNHFVHPCWGPLLHRQ